MDDTALRIRTARLSDAPVLLKIYAPYVEKTAITFECTVPDIEEFAARMRATLRRYPYLVAERGGEIVGRGRNRREEKQSTASHAEMEAIAMANETVGSWRLDDCTLYVTLEPCPMCAGAILNARIPRVYYGARDRAMGACGGVLNLYMEPFALTPALVGGVLADECRAVLENFFRGIRADKLP